MRSIAEPTDSDQAPRGKKVEMLVNQPNRRVWNGQIGKAPCGRCHRPNCTVMSDFTLMRHGNGCRGAHPDIQLYAMLRAAGLTEKWVPSR